MEKAVLEAKLRTVKGKACNTLRRQGLVPAVVYGRGIDSLPLEIDAKAFQKAISTSAGTNVIINLKISDNGKSKDIPVITHGIEKDQVTDKLLHIDFHHVIMTEKIKTRVRVEVFGEAVGVKDDGGVVVHGLREVEVECLPADIPEKFKVDISGLNINASLHVSDLKVPPEVVVLDKPEEMVVMVTPPSKEEEPVGPTAEEVLAAGAPAAEGAAATAAAPAEGEKKEVAPLKAEKK